MKSLKMNALAFLLVRILNIAFPLITGPYIARILAKENISHFDSVNTLAQLFIPFATFGIYTYGLRAISKVKNNKKQINILFSELFYLSIISTIITTIIYIIYIEYIETVDVRHHLYYIIGVQIFTQFLSIEWINEAFENYNFILYKTISTRILMLILIFIFVKESNDIVPYAVIMTIITVLNNIISFVWIKKDVKLVKISIKRVLGLFIPLISLLLLANVNMLYTYLDRLFLTQSNNPNSITDYVMAQNIVMLILGVISGAISVNVPRLSYYLGKRDYESYNYLLNKGARIFLFFISPISFGLIILGSHAALIYGSEKFLSAGIPTSIFAARAIIWTLDILLGTQIIFVNGHEKNLTKIVFTGGIINLITNTFLYKINIFNPSLYILTTILAESIVLLMYVIFIRKNNIANLKYIFKYTFKYGLSASSFIIVSHLVNIIYPVEMIVNKYLFINVALTIIACSISYFIILILQKDETLIEIINGIKNFLFRGKLWKK